MGEAVADEKRWIAENNILGSDLDHEEFPVAGNLEGNPLVRYLRRSAPKDERVASISWFDGEGAEYAVCRDEALWLSDGNPELADAIVEGRIPLHKMPRNLLAEGAAAERAVWLRKSMSPPFSSLTLKDLL
ncbi:MAG: hypothetical protein M0002_10295 [Rhodospirillales bacterium]|nr:hypothetical protein [Rhodospirillales bacterium]